MTGYRDLLGTVSLPALKGTLPATHSRQQATHSNHYAKYTFVHLIMASRQEEVKGLVSMIQMLKNRDLVSICQINNLAKSGNKSDLHRRIINCKPVFTVSILCYGKLLLTCFLQS